MSHRCPHPTAGTATWDDRVRNSLAAAGIALASNQSPPAWLPPAAIPAAAAILPRHVAVAGCAVLHSRRQVAAGDLHRGSCPLETNAETLPRRQRGGESFPVPRQSRDDEALGVNAMDNDDKSIGQRAELRASHRPGPHEMEAYERVLTDAMEGDRTLFAREDYVEEAWRIVDPVLKADAPVFDYAPGAWGSRETDQRVAPPGGWNNPTVSGRP